MRLNPGTRIGAFDVVAPIGSGGMGEVYIHDVEDPSTSFGNPITPEGFIFETVKLTGNLWRLRPREPVLP